MDFSGFNWGLFGLSVFGVLFVAWLVQVIRHRPSFWMGIVSFAHLFAAGLCSAAPVRGFVDPQYVGFQFGYLHTGAGIATTLLAGSIFLSAVISAFIAVRNKPGRAMWFVALTSLVFAINLGVSWLQSALSDISQNAIQFGEYLTIPGAVGTVMMFFLFVWPFAMGVGLAPRRARA